MKNPAIFKLPGLFWKASKNQVFRFQLKRSVKGLSDKHPARTSTPSEAQMLIAVAHFDSIFPTCFFYRQAHDAQRVLQLGGAGGEITVCALQRGLSWSKTFLQVKPPSLGPKVSMPARAPHSITSLLAQTGPVSGQPKTTQEKEPAPS